MLDRSPIVAIIPTTQPEAAKAFYRDVLGLPLTADDGFALVFDANGTGATAGGVATPSVYTPAP